MNESLRVLAMRQLCIECAGESGHLRTHARYRDASRVSDAFCLASPLSSPKYCAPFFSPLQSAKTYLILPFSFGSGTWTFRAIEVRPQSHLQLLIQLFHFASAPRRSRLLRMGYSGFLGGGKTVLLGLLGLSSLSSGSAVDFVGNADKVARGNEIGKVSQPNLGFFPRFSEFGEMSMKQPVLRADGASHMLRPRQSAGIEADCNPGLHSCAGLGQVGCCQNTHYCFVDSKGTGLCCPLGTQCNNDPCPTSSYFCTSTTTKFTTITATPGSPSAMLITTTGTGCCIRACLLSYHSCATSFGGNCCPNSSACIPNNMCTRTPPPTSTTFVPVPNACSTSSFACSDGGCCPNGFDCTQLGGTAGCTKSGDSTATRPIITVAGISANSGSVTVTPTNGGSGGSANGAVATSSATGAAGGGGGGLSTGAKAGIGIGAGLGVAALIGLGVVCIMKRQNSKKKANEAAAAAAAAAAATTAPMSPPPAYPPMQSPYPPSSPHMQQQQYFGTMNMPQQYQAYPPAQDPGYYGQQTASGKPSQNPRPASGAPAPYAPPGPAQELQG